MQGSYSAELVLRLWRDALLRGGECVMAKSKVSEFDLDQALSSPTSAFRRPEDVVEHPTLTRAQKIEILRRWVYDATQLAVAENEGMGGGEAAEIDVVMAALDRVKAG